MKVVHQYDIPHGASRCPSRQHTSNPSLGESNSDLQTQPCAFEAEPYKDPSLVWETSDQANWWDGVSPGNRTGPEGDSPLEPHQVADAQELSLGMAWDDAGQEQRGLAYVRLAATSDDETLREVVSDYLQEGSRQMSLTRWVHRLTEQLTTASGGDSVSLQASLETATRAVAGSRVKLAEALSRVTEAGDAWYREDPGADVLAAAQPYIDEGRSDFGELLRERRSRVAASSLDAQLEGLQVVDAAAWAELELTISQLPDTASPGARRLLQLAADRGVTLEPQVREALYDQLRRMGYLLPDPTGVLTTEEVEFALAEHIRERDGDFEALRERTDAANAPLTIGVIDVGFEVLDATLVDTMWVNEAELPYDFIDNDGNGWVDDRHGYQLDKASNDLHGVHERWHGTHVSGIATMGLGDEVDLMTIAAMLFGFTTSAGGGLTEIPDAIDYAVANGARIINLSIGGHDLDARVRQTIAAHPDVLFVNSAGNKRQQKTGGFGAEELDNLVCVGASGVDGRRLATSNYGAPLVSVAARAEFNASDAEDFRFAGQTSQASPHVANIAAKCLLLNPELTPGEIKQILIDTCDEEASWSEVTPEVESTVDPVLRSLVANTRRIETAVRYLLRADEPAALLRELEPDRVEELLAALDPEVAAEIRATREPLPARPIPGAESRGNVSAGKAMRLAALIGLVRGGQTPLAAADQLQLSSEHTAVLFPMLDTYVRT